MKSEDKRTRREQLRDKLLDTADQGLLRVAEIGAPHETEELIDLVDRLLERLNGKEDS